MSIEVCGPNEAMVKTAKCVGRVTGRQVTVGGCTCFWPCFQELHRMDLPAMTVKVKSEGVGTAEGKGTGVGTGVSVAGVGGTGG